MKTLEVAEEVKGFASLGRPRFVIFGDKPFRVVEAYYWGYLTVEKGEIRVKLKGPALRNLKGKGVAIFALMVEPELKEVASVELRDG